MATFVNAEKQTIYCDQCGEEKKLPIPCSVDQMIDVCNGFDLMHRHCSETTHRLEEKRG